MRERGYAVNYEESEDGVVSVAAAVRRARSPRLAALSISAPVSRMSEERIHEIGTRCRAAAVRLTGIPD